MRHASCCPSTCDLCSSRSVFLVYVGGAIEQMFEYPNHGGEKYEHTCETR